jgi:hypothetical protein
MTIKTVYNSADATAVDAHEDQVTEGLFHIPAGATETKPPSFNAETQTCQFIGDKWVVADIPVPEVEPEPEPYVLTYADKRQAEYPSVQECVHAILDDQLDALQAKRAEIKTKFPKG